MTISPIFLPATRHDAIIKRLLIIHQSCIFYVTFVSLQPMLPELISQGDALRELIARERGNANDLAFRIYIAVMETSLLSRCVRVSSERLELIEIGHDRSIDGLSVSNWYDYWHFHRSQIWNVSVFSRNSWRRYDTRSPTVYDRSKLFSRRWIVRYRKQRVLKKNALKKIGVLTNEC